ncbi:MAG: TrmH family RNA methyltransferase [Myxococcota bacterium]|nr:TrmH family RNA methyltransferase [Myxococcota bacterium]
MKRVTSEGRDVFRPKGQLAREISLATRFPEAVVAVLKERLSKERQARIDNVVSHRTRRIAVAIEGVRDPHNTAAVIRTADAFGVQVVHVIEHGDRFLSSRKVTQGAHHWVDLGVWPSPRLFVEAMHAEGKQVLIAAADSQMTLSEIDPDVPVAIVFGNEHAGVSREMQCVSDSAFRIPMFGFSQSINVSVAAGIAIAALRREGVGDLERQEAEILRARFYLRAVRAGYAIVQRTLGSEPDSGSEQ